MKGSKIPISELRKWQLESVSKQLRRAYKKKFRRRKETKYGNINRGFTDEELRRFFESCTNKKARFAFFLMSRLGLRLGEAVVIKLDDLDFTNEKIRISTEKAQTGDFLYLHQEVRQVIDLWIVEHRDEILQANNYLLFSQDCTTNVSPHWLRREFRDTCRLANLNQWYSEADDQKSGGYKKYSKPRKLYRLTTHSLRHYYITRIYKTCKNPIHTQKLARHREFSSTQVYIHSTEQEIDNTLKKAFEHQSWLIERKEE